MRHLNRTIHACTAVIALATAGMIASVLLIPLPCPTTRLATTRPVQGTLPLPALSSIEPVIRIDLRRGFAESTKAKSSFPAKLRGTIIEPGRSQAVFVTSDGRSALLPVGAEIAGARIIRIEADSVTIMHGGEELVLSVPRQGVAP